MINSEATKKSYLKGPAKIKDPKAELKRIVAEDYVKFVNDLSKDIVNDKAGMTSAITEFAYKNKVNLTPMKIQVTKLRPTQNEIDINGSINFPLGITSGGDMKTLEEYLACAGGEVPVAKKKIIALLNQKREFYVVDGHHRWSQLYFINPSCSISALTMEGAKAPIKDPFTSLKSAQLSIAANTGKVSIASVNGTNLLTVTKDKLKSIITTGTKPFQAKLVSTFSKYKKELNSFDKIFEYLWKNVAQMQQGSQPINGAPKRDVMPQTDAEGLTPQAFGKLLGNTEQPF
jgi:hypothetical protein